MNFDDPAVHAAIRRRMQGVNSLWLMDVAANPALRAPEWPSRIVMPGDYYRDPVPYDPHQAFLESLNAMLYGSRFARG